MPRVGKIARGAGWCQAGSSDEGGLRYLRAEAEQEADIVEASDTLVAMAEEATKKRKNVQLQGGSHGVNQDAELVCSSRSHSKGASL